VFSYLLGSISFGALVARLKGVDLRSVGSGNIGATNVLRTMGKVPALITLLGDLLKGSASVALARLLGVGELYEGLSGLASVVGHNYPVFLGFRGGKGVATSIGVVLIYMPLAGILTIALWLGTAIITRYSSLGALVAFGCLPLSAYLIGGSKTKIALSVIITIMLFFRHRENIKRLIDGTESKIGKRA